MRRGSLSLVHGSALSPGLLACRVTLTFIKNTEEPATSLVPASLSSSDLHYPWSHAEPFEALKGSIFSLTKAPILSALSPPCSPVFKCAGTDLQFPVTLCLPAYHQHSQLHSLLPPAHTQAPCHRISKCFSDAKDNRGLIIWEHFLQTCLRSKMHTLATWNKCTTLRRFLLCLFLCESGFFPLCAL